MPYIKNQQMIECPSDNHRAASDQWVIDSIDPNDAMWFSYPDYFVGSYYANAITDWWEGTDYYFAGGVGHVGPHQIWSSISLGSVADPTNTISFLEGTGHPGLWGSHQLNAPRDNWWGCRHRHNNQMNVLFCDGHAKSLGRGATRPDMYTIQDDQTAAGWAAPPDSNW